MSTSRATTPSYTLSLHDALPICFGGATCDDKSAQIYARFDKNDWRIQPAEFYRFHDAEVNTDLDRKSGSAGMPRPISYAVFCLKKKTDSSRRSLQIQLRSGWR